VHAADDSDTNNPDPDTNDRDPDTNNHDTIPDHHATHDGAANDHDARRWIRLLLLPDLVVGNLTLGSWQPALFWLLGGGHYLFGHCHDPSCDLDGRVLWDVLPIREVLSAVRVDPHVQ
jgi:hypothetical protein